MSSVVAVAYSHPTATEQQVEDLLWSKAQAVAARSGRAPIWPPTAHDTRDTDDGFIEHRALFTVKEIDR